MTSERRQLVRDVATELVRNHATRIEFLTVHEALLGRDDLTNLTEDDLDQLALDIHNAVVTATVVIEIPGDALGGEV